MWLLKDERAIFLHYAKKANKAGEVCEISDEELVKSLGLQNKQELYELKSSLKKHGLITFNSFKQNAYILNVGGKEKPVTSKNLIIRLTELGEEVAKKYGTPLGILELWCKEYIWFLVFLSVVMGVIGVLATVVIAIIKD